VIVFISIYCIPVKEEKIGEEIKKIKEIKEAYKLKDQDGVFIRLEVETEDDIIPFREKIWEIKGIRAIVTQIVTKTIFSST